MKYFSFGFFPIFILLFSFHANSAEHSKLYSAKWAAGNACIKVRKPYGFTTCPSSFYFAAEKMYKLTIGENVYIFRHANGACPTGTIQQDDYSCKDDRPPLCSIDDSSPDCLCSDNLPKKSGQYTSCDRPNLKYCKSLDTHIPQTDFCSLLPPDENNCPADTDFIDGQCVNKCGINSTYNGFTNKCEENPNKPKDHSCPSGYKNVSGTCQIDSDPKVDVSKTTTINEDNSVTTVTVTTTTINNSDGSQSVSKNTTTKITNPDGTTKSVDSKTTQSTKSPEEKKKDEDEKPSEISGGTDCKSPPVCSGDAIACAQTNLLWKISCSTPDQKIENESDCSKDFVCEGGVLQCAQLRSSRLQMCSSSTNALESLVNSSLPSNLNDISKVDSNGVLESAKGETFDLAAKLGLTAIFETKGASGACPAPYTFTVFGSQQTFDYELFICPTIRKINPLVVFAAMIFCSLLIYRAIEGL